MIPTFSPNSNSVSFVPRITRNVMIIIAVATTDEKVRIKKRYGCLRENMGF
jgi:hypothetical protein